MQIPYSSCHPAAAELRELVDRDSRQQSANDALLQPEFLAPDWQVLKSYSVVRALHAVALSCGINQRYAWAISIADADGPAGESAREARARLRFLAVSGVSERTEVALSRIADIAAEHEWKLPAEFPTAHSSKTESKDEEVKRCALVKRHKGRWPTIERDLSDASTNGLAEAAKVGKRGWHEQKAIAWAQSRAKYRDEPIPNNVFGIAAGCSDLNSVR